MNICIIPARGGSKRIPRKNIKEFNGKPIIAYSIEAALQSNCFSKVIVSTDDLEIAETAEKYGAYVPFIRPKILSDDYVGTTAVTKHAIEWFEREKSISVENVCCLYATAPFVEAATLKKALKQLQEEKAEYCFSLTNYPYPIQRAVRLTEMNRVEMIYPDQNDTRSQDLVDSYHDAGQFYWGQSSAFKEMKPLFSDISSPYVLPYYLVQDIDTLNDWKRAEIIYQFLQQREGI